MNDDITKARLRSINDKIHTAMQMVNDWTGDEEELYYHLRCISDCVTGLQIEIEEEQENE